MDSHPTDNAPMLEYRSGVDEHADLRRESRRRSSNALYLLVAVITATLGVVIGLVSFCGTVVGLFEQSAPMDWPIVGIATAFAVGMLWVSYWAAGRVESD